MNHVPLAVKPDLLCGRRPGRTAPRHALLADGPTALRYTAEKVDPSVAADEEKSSAFKLRRALEQAEITPVEKLFEQLPRLASAFLPRARRPKG